MNETLKNTLDEMDNAAEAWYRLPVSLFGDRDMKYFIATAQGNGMINAGIHDGDNLVFVATDTPDNFSIVYAILDNGEKFCRRYIKEGEKIRFRREDGVTPDIVVDKCQIIGQMVSLIRNFPRMQEVAAG